MAGPVARDYSFVQVDVFTDRIFGGNPLAVFLDGEGLSDAEMQAIAKEMNLSETTFLLPPSRPEYAARVRIFTPGRELPFAGHPTIGTAWVLAEQSLVSSGTTDLILEEGIGPVPVRFESDAAGQTMIWMRHGEATFSEPVQDRAAIARALGLTAEDLLADTPIRHGSTGNLFLYIPLRDRAAVDCAALDVPTLLACPEIDPSASVFVLAADPDPAVGRVYSRMFAPHTVGVPEDPATGSAAGPLGVYLVREGLAAPADEVRVICEQGTKMGRQSFLHILLRDEGDGSWAVEVGGSVVPVLTGELTLPTH